jgi:hypothetical protein
MDYKDILAAHPLPDPTPTPQPYPLPPLNDDATVLYAKWAAVVMSAEAVNGNRNNALFLAACEGRGRQLPLETVAQILRPLCNGLSEPEFITTLKSAFSKERNAHPPKPRKQERKTIKNLRADDALDDSSSSTAMDLLALLKSFQPSWIEGRKIFYTQFNHAYSVGEAWSLDGVMELVAKSPEYLELKIKTQIQLVALSKAMASKAALSLCKTLPERKTISEALDVSLEHVKSVFTAFLSTPRMFYSDDGVPKNISYASWLQAINPDTENWVQCFQSPIWGHPSANNITQMAIKGEFLWLQILSKIFPNQVWAGRYCHAQGLVTENKMISVNGRKLRALIVSPDLVDYAISGGCYSYKGVDT